MATNFGEARRRTREPARPAGFTIIEVLIAVCILAFCGIPIMIMITSETKKAHFNEFHANAQTQARWAADALQSLDFDHLLALHDAPIGTAAGLPGLNDGDMKEIPDPLDNLGNILKEDLVTEPKNTAFLAHAVGRWKFYRRQCFIQKLDDGLARLLVYVSWKLPTDTGKIRHHHVYRRLVVRPETSMTTNVPFKQQ